MGSRGCVEGSKRVPRTARFSTSHLALLAAAGRQLNGPLDLSSALSRVSAFVVPRLADWYVLALTQADGHLRAVAYQHRDPPRRALLADLAAATRFDQPAASAMARAGGGTLGWLPRLTAAPWRVTGDVCGWTDADLARLGTGSIICAPLTHASDTLGAVLLARSAPDGYDASTVEVAAEISRRVGVTLANAWSYQALQEELQQVNEALAVAAHELRTPAAALRGTAQVLLRQYERTGTLETEEVRMALSRIDRQAVRLAGMIDRLMDAACADSGKLSVVRSETDLREVVVNAVDLARAVHPERQVAVDAPSAVQVRVDSLRIQQVLSNLIDNAFKFSPTDAPVEVALRVPRPGSAVVAVRDHGIGVPVERRDHIFDRFVQAHCDQAPAGLGLGLYLSQRIVEQHGGRLTADYPHDGGARFVVELPALDRITLEYRALEDDADGGTLHDTAGVELDRRAGGRSGRSASGLRSTRLHRLAGLPGALPAGIPA
jgi:signal transduction histidine kinase